MTILLALAAVTAGLALLNLVLSTLFLPPGWRPHRDASKAWDREPFHG